MTNTNCAIVQRGDLLYPDSVKLVYLGSPPLHGDPPPTCSNEFTWDTPSFAAQYRTGAFIQAAEIVLKQLANV